MRPIAVIAQGAVSALGTGRAAFSVGEPHAAAPSAIAHDPEFAERGLRFPLSARSHAVESLGPLARDEQRARALIALAVGELCKNLDTALPGWRGHRLALAIGTSGGGMRSLERALELRARGATVERALARQATYFGPLAGIAELLAVEPELCVQVLAACASSTVALGLGCRWLEQGHADLVIAGGYDALSVFIAAGFEALHATTKSSVAPFRAGRDGMALGEGAAFVALTRAAESSTSAWGFILGFGAASDAIHVTAPDRTGAGLARAGATALRDAGLDGQAVDLVSAHGTATPFNDAAEANAISSVLGAGVPRAVVHPFKGSIGHSLGAAGALETLSALDALSKGLLPAACGEGEIEPALEARLLAHNTPSKIRYALKLSTAFGGADAALALGAALPEGAGRELGKRPVRLLASGKVIRSSSPSDAGLASLPELKRQRLDSLSQLVISAAADAFGLVKPVAPERSGVIVGSAGATLELNEVFAAKLRSRGPRGVEPRRFPATSPNLSAGECSIALGLRGPAFAVGAAPNAASEALLVAHDLIEAGDADLLIVVAAEDAGPVVAELFSRAGLPQPSPGAVAAVLGTGQQGTQVDRRMLAMAHREAAAPGLEPGWPIMLAILGRVVAGGAAQF